MGATVDEQYTGKSSGKPHFGKVLRSAVHLCNAVLVDGGRVAVRPAAFLNQTTAKWRVCSRSASTLTSGFSSGIGIASTQDDAIYILSIGVSAENDLCLSPSYDTDEREIGPADRRL